MDHHPQLLCAALCIASILKLSHGVDTLSPGQILGDGDVLISPNQIFELGFFSPRKCTKFLGLWYKSTPDVVVWVANRNNPILNSQGVLTLSQNGTLILTSTQNTTIWSSNSSKLASNPTLKLLDSGNLVLVDISSNTWQSFDYPCDTRLPGMKMAENLDPRLDIHLTSWKSSDDPSIGDLIYRIENQGVSKMSIFCRGEKRFRTGPWNGLYFTGLPLVREPAFGLQTVFSNGSLVSLSNPYNDSVFIRLTLNYSGFLQQYIMNEQRDGWVLVYSLPSDTCDNYGRCGPNTVCKSFKSPLCECLKGFGPKSPKDWSLSTWTRGCTRILPVDCIKEDGFLEVERMKFPDTLNYRIDTSMSRSECRKECLNNCSCSAYAAPYLINERNGCLMWFGDLVDVKEFTGEVSTAPSIYFRVPISELGKEKGPVKYVYVAIAACLGIFFVSLVFGCKILRNRRNKRAWKKKREDLELPFFYLATIAAATNNFSDENMIGKGGFGPVYKGNLSDGQVAAVKRMSRTSGQGPREFKNEVVLIAKLQHRNLVKISGCCIEGEEMMLIYEYMQNKSLDYFIFDESRSAELSWTKRFDIIMGIARGLLYLHHDSRLKIIHRDLKTSNILLDDNLNAKISDFGLARMFQGDQTTARTKKSRRNIVSSMHYAGYMAPEYVFDGKLSIKSDVFSMGVVILEIVSGKKNRGFKHPSCYHNLLQQAWLLWMENRDLELMDPCYNNSYVESQVKRCIQVGLLCIQNVADDRPEMPYVLLMLSSEDSVLPRPKKPGFFLHNSSSSSQRNASGSEEIRSSSITISEVEARKPWNVVSHQ